MTFNVILPTFKFDKDEISHFGIWNTTEISLPTKISLTHNKKCIKIIMAVLGFGIFISWRESE